MTSRLFYRFVLIVLVMALLVGGVVLALTGRLVTRSVSLSYAAELSGLMSSAEEALSVAGESGRAEEVAQGYLKIDPLLYLGSLSSLPGGELPEGEGSSPLPHSLRPLASLLKAQKITTRFFEFDGERILDLQTKELRMGLESASFLKRIAKVYFWLSATALLAILVGLFVIFFLARRALRPLEQLARDATQIAGCEERGLVPIRNANSLEPLASTLRSLAMEHHLIEHQNRELHDIMRAQEAASAMAELIFQSVASLVDEEVVRSEGADLPLPLFDSSGRSQVGSLSLTFDETFSSEVYKSVAKRAGEWKEEMQAVWEPLVADWELLDEVASTQYTADMELIEQVRSAVAEGSYLVLIAGQYARFYEVLGGEGGFTERSVVINALLDQLSHDVRPLFGTASISFLAVREPEAVEARCDPLALFEVLRALILSAWREVGVGTISLRATRRQKAVQFTVDVANVCLTAEGCFFFFDPLLSARGGIHRQLASLIARRMGGSLFVEGEGERYGVEISLE